MFHYAEYLAVFFQSVIWQYLVLIYTFIVCSKTAILYSYFIIEYVIKMQQYAATFSVNQLIN